jgi:hypothetical protein
MSCAGMGPVRLPKVFIGLEVLPLGTVNYLSAARSAAQSMGAVEHACCEATDFSGGRLNSIEEVHGDIGVWIGMARSVNQAAGRGIIPPRDSQVATPGPESEGRPSHLPHPSRQGCAPPFAGSGAPSDASQPTVFSVREGRKCEIRDGAPTDHDPREEARLELPSLPLGGGKLLHDSPGLFLVGAEGFEPPTSSL